MLPGVVMFISYLVAGILPLFPYIVFPTETALIYSVLASLTGLFVLGFISGKISHVHRFREAMKMLILGGAAVFIGVAVGMLVK